MALVFVLLLLMLLLGVPIAYGIGLAASFGLLTAAGVNLAVVPQRMFTMLDSFSLLAIPFFVLAGNLMDRGGISKKLIRFASCIVGHIRGGLGMVRFWPVCFLEQSPVPARQPAQPLAH